MYSPLIYCEYFSSGNLLFRGATFCPPTKSEEDLTASQLTSDPIPKSCLGRVPCLPRNWTLVPQPCCQWAAVLWMYDLDANVEMDFTEQLLDLLVNFLSEIGLRGNPVQGDHASHTSIYWWLCSLKSMFLISPHPQSPYQILGPEKRNWFIPTDSR